MRIHYNAPLILNFSIICVVLTVINQITQGSITSLIQLPGSFNFANPIDYLNLITYTFGHSGYGHLIGNLTFILLLGPTLEEKYGRKDLAMMIGLTAVVTAILNILFFDSALWGASGIVFLFIMLNSFTGFKENHIPLTFILVAILFLGTEIYNAIAEDNKISEFAHITGGIAGSYFGFQLNKRLRPSSSAESSEHISGGPTEI
jgi:GlpG protein